jgi:WD40 repeat protein
MEVDSDWVCTQTLAKHSSTVWAASFNNDGNYLISCSDDMSLCVWEKTDKNFVFLHKLENCHSRAIYSVSWSKVNDLVATCSGDNFIKIWRFDYATKNLVFIESIENAHGHYDVNCVCWCPLQNHADILASCGDDFSIKLWSCSLNI